MLVLEYWKFKNEVCLGVSFVKQCFLTLDGFRVGEMLYKSKLIGFH